MTCFHYDAVGRETERIMNCVTGGSSSSSSSSSSAGCPESADTNVTVRTAYTADGQVASLTAVNAATGNQTTAYVYGTTLADSDLAASTLKRAEVYPDSVDSDDRITFAYNRQQQVTAVTDQNGTVHAYDYDKLGRQTQDRVTTLGTGVDGGIRRIATTYEVRGMRETVTSCDDATVGQSSIVNEVHFAYNDFGQLTADSQSHSGAVNTMSTPKVQYGYADGSDNTIRPTALTYPDGRVLTYDYGTSGGTDDAASRVASLIDDDVSATHLVDYSYLGRDTFVEVDYTEPDLKYTFVGTAGGTDPDTGDIYRGLDRFGRVKDSYWYDYGSATDVDRLQYGYDRAGNRLWRKNTVAAALGKSFDELYAYNGLHRLADMQRGALNANRDAVTNLQFAECWQLDETGNWRNFRQDDDGDGTWDLEQSRMANAVNEITGISETTGPAWATPAYSRAGNMTTIPQPADPTQSYTVTYDAWNRLATLVDSTTGDAVQRAEYDGRSFRIICKDYSTGILDRVKHTYYTSSWQAIEDRIDASNDPEQQFVWGRRYLGDLVLRDRETHASGTFDERLYVLEDPNWNVVASATTSGDIAERFAYSSYGVPIALADTFAINPSSLYDWDIQFAAYCLDDKSKLYYARHRYYVSHVGVWSSRDVLIYADGLNLSEYVHSKPFDFVDPFGLQGIDGVLDPGYYYPYGPSNWAPGMEWPPPPSPPRGKEEVWAKFMAWYNANKDTAWATSLPACPCNIGKRCPEFASAGTGAPGYPTGRTVIEAINPDPQVWENPTSWLFGYHKGAKWCMRSKPVGNSAQQCCYSGDGKLITHGSGTGSADRMSTGVRNFGRGGHQDVDVAPADWADELDGGKFGKFNEMYLALRPSNNANGCPRNP